jgi:hypothetical protein
VEALGLWPSEFTRPFEDEGQLDSNEIKVMGSCPLEGEGGVLLPRPGPCCGIGGSREMWIVHDLPSLPAEGQHEDSLAVDGASSLQDDASDKQLASWEPSHCLQGSPGSPLCLAFL